MKKTNNQEYIDKAFHNDNKDKDGLSSYESAVFVKRKESISIKESEETLDRQQVK